MSFHLSIFSEIINAWCTRADFSSWTRWFPIRSTEAAADFEICKYLVHCATTDVHNEIFYVSIFIYALIPGRIAKSDVKRIGIQSG